MQKRFELREKVFNALTTAWIEMPFETIQLAPHKVTMVKAIDKGDKPERQSLYP
jgi:small conductance mechanosensitive channel